MQYIQLKQIKVAQQLVNFVDDKVLPGLSLKSTDFWPNFESVITRNLAENNALLLKRDEIQQQLDDWYRSHSYNQNDLGEYKQFLTDIGYLVEEGEDFKVSVVNVDREISTVAAPQLVVPINNARFALNAANARWGSLFDALYGTDMIADSGITAKASGYNEKRGEQVFEFCQNWLDDVLPLTKGSHGLVVEYHLLQQNGNKALQMELADGSTVALKRPEQFIGYAQNKSLALVFVHNELHFEISINRDDPIGSFHRAGVRDIILEAAVTTIEDCEDSVAAVDIEDKIEVYSNWLGLIDGSLSFEMSKGGKTFTRRLNPDREYRDTQDSPFKLPGRSLMLIRNTGIHMKTDLALTLDDQPLPEGIIDALMTVLISLHDRKSSRKFSNSASGSIYIVKPKMHGPLEVAFSCKVFGDVEKAYGLPTNTIKIGIMDEERRTTVNLKECIRQARERVIFINTGFLDRTGDEIHTSMEAGPMLPKAEIKKARWIGAYENWNVDVGLLCGLDVAGQIGKGMWAEPDRLLEMYKTKRAHPQAGASCAWVPSPTAATLHALHYHKVNVKQIQQGLKQRPRASLDDILSVPLLPAERQLTPAEIQSELENNAQGILGYVVKWVDTGIGCSKVPDIHDTGLMEDRATLRISSQQLANWLRHGLCSKQQLVETFQRMARVVDQQNADSPGYIAMADGFDGLAFQAAMALVLEGAETANGYTEDLLHAYRRRIKTA